jgi:6-phosphogluconolactonase
MRHFGRSGGQGPGFGWFGIGLMAFGCGSDPGSPAGSGGSSLGAAGSGGAAGVGGGGSSGASGSAGRGGTSSGGAGGAGSGGTASGSGGASGSAGAGGTGGAPGSADRPFVYVGSYENAIHVFALNSETGALAAQGAPVTVNPSPSFLAFAPDLENVYAVNEADNVDTTGSGAVSAFALDRGTGGLTFLNRVSSGGAGPAHVLVDPSGRFALVANYNGGNFSVLPLGTNGELGAAVAGEDHGDGAQAHQVVLDPSNRFLFVANKGRSDISQYRFDATTGSVTPNTPPELDLAGGAGTRHLAFHPSLPYAYAINELDDTVVVLAFDAAAGTLTMVQTLSSLPAGANGGQSTGAEIQVAPSGRFVYGSNRGGNDTIVIYSVDAANGRLALVGHQPTGGDTPRSFQIERSGRVLLVANQDSDQVVSFRVDTDTGLLTELTRTSVPSPAFVGVLYLPEP